jgi:single-strand DNA-binding protein
MSVHKLTLVGYLGQDPESRSLPSGVQVTNCSLATTERWKDKSGERQERTTWFRLAFFGPLADIASQYLRKGSLIYVEGQVSARPWTNKQGEAQASLEVNVREMKMLGGARAENRREDDGAPQATSDSARQKEEFDDDIPF